LTAGIDATVRANHVVSKIFQNLMDADALLMPDLGLSKHAVRRAIFFILLLVGGSNSP
jgi:phage tail protein X